MKRAPKNRTVADLPETDTVHRHEPTKGRVPYVHLYAFGACAHSQKIIRVQLRAEC